MQYKVPQNIDKEDEIVGPLTLVQFSYVAIAGAIDFLVFKTLPLGVGLLIIIPISLIAVAFAFVKIQDQPLLHFIMAMVEYSRRPKTRVWDKQSDRPILQVQQKTETAQPTVAHKNLNPDQVSQIAQVLDTRGHVGHEHPEEQQAPMPFKNVKPETLEQ